MYLRSVLANHLIGSQLPSSACRPQNHPTDVKLSKRKTPVLRTSKNRLRLSARSVRSARDNNSCAKSISHRRMFFCSLADAADDADCLINKSLKNRLRLSARSAQSARNNFLRALQSPPPWEGLGEVPSFLFIHLPRLFEG